MLVTIEKVLLLKQMEPFKTVSNMALSDLMSVAEEQTLKEGTVLINESEPNKKIHFLLSGTVKVQKGQNTQTINSKTVLGLHSVFWMGPADEQVKITQKAVVLSVAQDKLYRVMALHPSLAFAVLNELSVCAHQ